MNHGTKTIELPELTANLLPYFPQLKEQELLQTECW